MAMRCDNAYQEGATQEETNEKENGMAVSTSFELGDDTLRWNLPWSRKFYLCHDVVADDSWFTLTIVIFQAMERITLQLTKPVDNIEIDFALEGDW